MKLKLLIASALFLLLGASPVQAVSIPNFPACTSPSGSVKVNYASGIHGIPGDAGQYVGSDVVYTVSDTQLTQCFCAVSGSGIQTNWWKQSSLDGDQISTLQNQGWIFIPDGSAWGLDPVPYLAKNSNFSCGGGGNGGNGGGQPGPGPAPVCDSGKPGTPQLVSVQKSGTKALLTWSAASQATHYTIGYGTTPNSYPYGVPNTGNVTTFTIGALNPDVTYYFAVRAVNNCMPGDWSGSPVGMGGGQVLGLATTGNSTMLYVLLVLGGLSLVLAILARRRTNRA